ncbi:hypothetical protein ACFPH6_01965 [Streptomyces xiangluensis]|uniref:Uncharacterized protein n=1 Tax=Streptomyces xiangluensis TaxID=2665720 RepID=A0ABV8YGL0_9ACTN
MLAVADGRGGRISGSDGHIHVESNVLREGAAVRDVLAATFGHADDLPGEVATGCSLRVPFAMTCRRPESVTCLPCRERAGRQHLHFAEQVERLADMPGASLDRPQADRVAARYRELARRFSDT